MRSSKTCRYNNEIKNVLPYVVLQVKFRWSEEKFVFPICLSIMLCILPTPHKTFIILFGQRGIRIHGSFHLLLKPSATSSVTSQTGRRGCCWEQHSENITENLPSSIQQSYQHHPKISPNLISSHNHPAIFNQSSHYQPRTILKSNQIHPKINP
jgi:hypothetical protein